MGNRGLLNVTINLNLMNFFAAMGTYTTVDIRGMSGKRMDPPIGATLLRKPHRPHARRARSTVLPEP
jgi:hypothetical protein